MQLQRPRAVRRTGGMEVAVTLLAGALAAPPTGAGLHFIDVGQGSALLVIGREGHAVMIDSGPPGAAEAVIHALDEHGLLRVDLWIHTHFDADHVGGFARVIAGADAIAGSDDDIDVTTLWDRGLDGAPGSDAVAAYHVAAGDRRRTAASGDLWEVPGLSVRLVDTGIAAEIAAENARGLALCVDIEGLRLLAPGDLPAAQAAVAAAACGVVDLLWAAHHGGVDGTSEAVLAAADPALVIISAGHDNAYCHPAAVTLARLRERAVWISDLAGGGPLGRCPGLATSFAADHRLLSGDLWLAAPP
jgi:beta-lactamase superfamily II metal-dependent hydrolase